MSERPIILFPKPQLVDRDKRKYPKPNMIHKPTGEEQYFRLLPKFEVLRKAFEKKKVQIQNSPIGMNPEYALVFEVIGSVNNFFTAVKKLKGLEWLFDNDSLMEPDNDFYFDTDKTKYLSGKVYCIMSNQEAMEQMLSCWKRYIDGEKNVFARGLAGLRDIFPFIKNIRKWTAEDRIQETRMLEYWKEDLEIDGNDIIPFEIELFYRNDDKKRIIAEATVSAEIENLNGRILSKCQISEISYHSLLVELPRNSIEMIVKDYNQVQLVQVDDIMFFRPTCQSMFNISSDIFEEENIENEELKIDSQPIIGILDGMPIQNHPLLKNRIIVDDPDDFQNGYESKNRVHGTAMASLILNGDLNKKEFLQHRIYLRPILKSEEVGIGKYSEMVPRDCLIVDKIHSAIVRLFEKQNGIEPIAPSIRIINLSLGDSARQLSTSMSPLAKLIDYLAYKYSILFIVSAGNHPETIDLLESSFNEYKLKDMQERSKEYFEYLIKSQRNIKLLSPSETINGLTIGAIYDDYCDVNENDRLLFAVRRGLPSPISSFGTGYRTSIKPDLFYLGGRKFITNDINRWRWVESCREPGCRVAAPSKESTKNWQAYSFGTSDATALVSHEALKCYDILNDIYLSETGSVPPKEYIAIIIKAMLVHGASWGNLAKEVAELVGESEKRVSKWLGNGIPDISRVEDCAKNRVTLIGTGSIRKEEGHLFTLPLPIDISSKVIKRKLVVSLAYFSPIESNKQKYRSAKLWFDIIGNEELASNRVNTDWQAVQKGTLQHEIFEDEKVLLWNDDKEIQIKVNCKEDEGKITEPIKYCIFVTFEVAEEYDVDVYSNVVNKIKTVIRT